MRNLAGIRYFVDYSWPLLIVASFVAFFDLKFDAVGGSFLVLSVQSSLLLSGTMHGVLNLVCVYYTFSLIFLNLVPWLHYSTGSLIWASTQAPTADYLLTNALIFISSLIVSVAHKVTRGSHHAGSEHTPSKARSGLSLTVLLLLSFAGLLGVLYLNSFSLQSVLFRGLVDQVREQVLTASSLNLMFGMVVRLLPLFCFLYAVTEIPRRGMTKLALFIFLLIAVFPTGVSRYMVAFTYIPVMLTLVPASRRAPVFVSTLMLSILFVFPFLEQFRYYDSFDTIQFLPDPSFFFAGHFDAYENMLSAIHRGSITYGYQLLGVIFFFVPRALWPSKPVGTGYELAESSGYTFNNISMTFLGEGYVNFGFLGIIVFSIFIGFGMAKIDKSRASREGYGVSTRYSNTVNFFLIGALFFVLRGDLLSGFSYTAAGLVVAWSVGVVMKFVRG